MIKKNKIEYYFFIVLLYLLVFQNFFEIYIPYCKYIDEILAVLIFPIVLIKKSWKVKKIEFRMLIGLFLILITGLYSNLKLEYQNIGTALTDAILLFKFFLVYFLFNILKDDINNIDNKKILFHFKCITIILFAFTVLNYMFTLYPHEYRYGILCNKLFYQQPTFLSAACVFVLSGIIRFSEEKDKNKKYLLMLFFIIVSTLRMKSIAFVFVALIILLYVEKTNKKITFYKLAIMATIVIIIAIPQIKFYFIEIEDSARNVLLKTSFKIANDFFPFGTGFATFASHFSAVEYSPVYELYEISNIHGLQKFNTSFIADSFWPMILGQFGYFGLIIYIGIIYSLFKKMQYEFDGNKKNNKVYISKCIVLIYLLISSTSETAFVNPLAIPLAIILAL